jgi:hypothetical protein
MDRSESWGPERVVKCDKNEPKMKRFGEEMSEISSKQDLKKSGGWWCLYLGNGWADFDDCRLN